MKNFDQYFYCKCNLETIAPIYEKGKIMKYISVIFMSILAIGASPVWAEDNGNSKMPSFIGDVSGIEESDTFGYRPEASEDIYVLSHPCGTKPCDKIYGNANGNPERVGTVTGNPEKDTIAYTDTFLQLSGREECYFAGCGTERFDGVANFHPAR